MPTSEYSLSRMKIETFSFCRTEHCFLSSVDLRNNKETQKITVLKNSLFNSYKHVRKVSTIFKYFLSRFACEPVLPFRKVVLDVQFNALLNGIKFDGSHRPENKLFGRNLSLFRKIKNCNSCPDLGM